MAMPSRKAASGRFMDIAHPINNTTRQKIENALILEYNRELVA